MIFLILFFGALLILYLYLTWNFDFWQKQGVPSAKAQVLFGSLPNVLFQKEHMKYDVDKIYDEFKGKTPFVGFIQIRGPRLMVMEPELIKEVLIKSFKNFRDNEFAGLMSQDDDPLFSRNPFFLKGEEWKEKRAEITPAFTANRLKVMYPLVEEVQGQMVKYINEKISTQKTPFDARELCTLYTIDVVAKAIYGIDAKSFVGDKSEIREIVRRLFAPSGLFILKMFMVASLPFLKNFFNMRFTPVDIEHFFINLMKDSISYREKNNVKRDDFLDYLLTLKAKKGLQEIDMASHTISFFTDGTETSANAISHTLYELGKNQQVQDKLRDEIINNTDSYGKISFEALNEMPYIDQVIHEALRMHPPAVFVNRICTEDIKLEYEGRKATVFKDMNILIPIYQIHYDSEHYEDPESFKPERFDAEVGGLKKYKDKGVYLPFGDGPRICLGMKFALMQSKAAIAAIIKNFVISVNEKTADKMVLEAKEFLNVKVGGLWLDFKPIEA